MRKGCCRWQAQAVVMLCLQVAAAAHAVTLQPFLSGLSSPIFMTNAKDGTGRLFVVEQGGVIRVLQPGSTTPTVFLNITSKVLSGGERGLLGLAFHPFYETNRRFFVNYTRQPDGATVVAEYTASAGDPNVANTTETILLTVAQPYSNHNGGMVEFGPDGYLYIGMGDGGSGNDPGNRAQNINELLGKMLRIDVDTPNGPVPYSSPATNPYFGATPGADEIYAIGLRNPWRFSFDRMGGTLWVGDVGQGAWEEIDVVTLGANYGWRVFEGNHCTGNDPGLCGAGGFTAPVGEYFHSGGRCSITGGYVYRGTAGALTAGEYIFGDFCTGEIFGSGSGVLLDTSLLISSFAEDEAGEQYVVSLGGVIQKLVPGTPVPTATSPPTATRTATMARTPTPTPSMTSTPMHCGNVVLEPDEQCDDGNVTSGDGCSDTCQSELVPGGSAKNGECVHEWLLSAVPAANRKGLPANKLECTDDDPACDFGTPGDAACTFHVALCFNATEQRFACVPSDVARVELRRPKQQSPRSGEDTANRDALENALAGIGGGVRGQCTNRGVKQKQVCAQAADCDSFGGSGDGKCGGRFIAFEPPLTAANVCTALADVRVPVSQRATGNKPGRKMLRLLTHTSAGGTTGRDSDSLTLTCKP